MRTNVLMVAGLLGWIAACGGDDAPAAGSVGGACYGNGSCDDGLTCLSDLCVALPDASVGQSDAAVTDAAVTDAANPGDCDPVDNTGCGATEKCGVINDTDQLNRYGCGPEGTVILGDACTYEATVADGGSGMSDCVGGTECYGVCTKVCDIDGAVGCQGDQICIGSSILPDSGNVFGLCSDTCDPLTQAGCSGTQACYLAELTAICGEPYCETDVSTGYTYDCEAGDGCYDGTNRYYNVCAEGKSCIPRSESESICMKMCDASFTIGLTFDPGGNVHDFPLADGSGNALDDPDGNPWELNGIAPYNCGSAPDSLVSPRYVCIPLFSSTYVSWYGPDDSLSGLVPGLGLCVDTDVAGNLYGDEALWTGGAASFR